MKPHHHHRATMFIIDDKPPLFTVELTVVSADGLDAAAAPISCSPFPRRRHLRPFASITMAPPELRERQHNGPSVEEYMTEVDLQGGENPAWGDEFRIPVGSDFFANPCSCLYLCVYDLRSSAGCRRLLGWCQIAAGDFWTPPPGAVRQLSYRLRGRDGTRGSGVVNVAVGVEHRIFSAMRVEEPSGADTCGRVIGLPVGLTQRPSPVFR